MAAFADGERHVAKKSQSGVQRATDGDGAHSFDVNRTPIGVGKNRTPLEPLGGRKTHGTENERPEGAGGHSERAPWNTQRSTWNGRDVTWNTVEVAWGVDTRAQDAGVQRHTTWNDVTRNEATGNDVLEWK